jgi:hypothetical protein
VTIWWPVMNTSPMFTPHGVKNPTTVYDRLAGQIS